ncbi:MAG: hypothetical protein ACKVYV_10415 [Limisphaerales bacterium]
MDPKAPLLLRVAETYARGSLTEYDFRYIGLEPGTYDLRDFLLRADGSGVSNLPPLTVTVASVLPPKHDGRLLPPPPTPWAKLAGYRTALVLAGTAWVAGLVALLLWRRRRPAAVVEAAAAAPPTLAERLRPLVELAAAGRLDADGQAQLERLLHAHWRERLGLESLPAGESLARLKAHPEAGALLRTLEDWLHRRPGSVTVAVEAALAPYRSQPVLDGHSALHNPPSAIP